MYIFAPFYKYKFKMRNITYSAILILVLAFFSSCENEPSNSYTVSLELNGVENQVLFMQNNKQGEWIKIDSAELKDGKASFSGTIDLPQMFYFTLNNSKSFIPVFVEQGTIKVIADAKNLREPTITGSASNDIYQKLTVALQAYDDKARELSQQFREAQSTNDVAKMENISKDYEAMEDEKSNTIKDFALANSNSVVAPYTAMNYSYMFELVDLEAIASQLPPSVASSDYTIALNNRVAILKRVEIGQPYVDFTLNDPEGKPIPLSSIAEGNYVLVDFWASWCSPCRAENPNVVLAYEKFHDKGFEIFGVSFDRDHDKWVEAIEKDGLNWSQVSDLKFWQCEAGKLYGVQSIPHSILLDPNGIIIAKNLRGEELQNKLAELLN